MVLSHKSVPDGCDIWTSTSRSQDRETGMISFPTSNKEKRTKKYETMFFFNTLTKNNKMGWVLVLALLCYCELTGYSARKENWGRAQWSLWVVKTEPRVLGGQSSWSSRDRAQERRELCAHVHTHAHAHGRERQERRILEISVHGPLLVFTKSCLAHVCKKITQGWEKNHLNLKGLEGKVPNITTRLGIVPSPPPIR